MKVTDKITKAEQEGRPFWSFEYFPPKTPQVRNPNHSKINPHVTGFLTVFSLIIGCTKLV